MSNDLCSKKIIMLTRPYGQACGMIELVRKLGWPAYNEPIVDRANCRTSGVVTQSCSDSGYLAKRGKMFGERRRSCQNHTSLCCGLGDS